TWQVAYEQASKRVVPARFARVNEKYVRALGILASAGKDYARGIDDLSAVEMSSANEEMQSATHELKSAADDFPAQISSESEAMEVPKAPAWPAPAASPTEGSGAADSAT